MEVLVTGANGFIGSTLCEALIKRNYKVRGLVRKTSDLRFVQDLDIELVCADLSDKHSLAKATKGVDIVYHIAALVNDWGSLKLFREMNVEGTRNILEAAVSSKVKRFVYVSTLVVHSFLDKTDMTEESPVTPPPFPYCISKKEAEEVVMEFYVRYKLPITIIRTGDVIGPKDRTFFLKMVKALERGIIPYLNQGRSLFAFTYVENLVDGIILAGNSEKAIGQTYVITDGIKITWKEFFDMLTKEMGVPKPFFSVSSKIIYPLAFFLEIAYKLLGIKQRPPVTRYMISHAEKNVHFSIEKARRELNYQPRISLIEAIRRMVEWYRTYKP